MKSLFWSYETKIESAYIITIKDNNVSEELSNRCAKSCDEVGMPYKIWEAYDATKTNTIIVPERHKSCSFMNMIKVMDNYLTRAEVACALSHISLWVNCVNIDKPIVILEHDAIVLKALTHFPGFNTILHLGSIEWAEQGWPIMQIPIHASDGPNKHFICRAHSYAIDPIVAKNMLANVLKMGIYTSLDVMISADLYNISHIGCLAYDKPGETTIRNRAINTRRLEKNDDLRD